MYENPTLNIGTQYWLRLPKVAYAFTLSIQIALSTSPNHRSEAKTEVATSDR